MGCGKGCVMMKLAIMQPYFLPYIGYWQLMNAVDQYVVYDDVQFIKGGWIGRNRILVNGEPRFFNVPMLGVSPNKLINEIGVDMDDRIVKKKLRAVEGAYHKSPHFQEIFPMVEAILCSGQNSLVGCIMASFEIICRYLDIETELVLSSQLQKDCSLRGQEKILAICEGLGATEYYNAINGKKLYEFEAFRERGISLSFLKTDPIQYTQFGNEFQENLSILDMMMFCSREQIKEYLTQYSLIKG